MITYVSGAHYPYHAWRLTMDLATYDDADQERVALKAAQRAVTLMSSFNDMADSNGKTKMMHIIVYIIPRFIRSLGNLWKYFTAKLEARGKTCKIVVRRQTCPRKPSIATEHTISERGTVAEKRRGVIVEGSTTFTKSYDSSQMAQLVGVIGLLEQRALMKRSRGASQLAKMGRQRQDVKLPDGASAVPAEVRKLLPESHPFTCVSIFESILRGEIEPLYSLDGVFRGQSAE